MLRNPFCMHSCVMHACVARLYAYAFKLHAYALMFIRRHASACVRIHGPSIRIHRLNAQKLYFFVQFDFFFFTYFFIQHNSYASILVFYMVYHLSRVEVVRIICLHGTRI